MEKEDLRELERMARELDDMAKELEKEAKELAKFEDQMRQLEENGPLDFPHRLPTDYPAPGEILPQHFPDTAEQRGFRGGWGYDAGDAVKLLESDPCRPSSRPRRNSSRWAPVEKFDRTLQESSFIDKRIREELIFSRPETDRFVEPDFQVMQSEVHRLHGVPHDFVEVEVTAYPEAAWNELKADWDAHEGYEDDPEGREAHLKRKEAAKIVYRTEFWFDIADFH